MRYLSFRIFLALLFSSILANIVNNNKFKLIQSVFHNNVIKFEFLVILVWVLTTYFDKLNFLNFFIEDKKKAKAATKHAILALIIFFCELLEQPTQLFWLIWITAFFLEEWV